MVMGVSVILMTISRLHVSIISDQMSTVRRGWVLMGFSENVTDKIWDNVATMGAGDTTIISTNI